MSGMNYSGSGTNQEIDDQPLPGYVPYLTLMFKMIATTVILLLSGWVVYTIKTTTSLHKPHNIFVANLLVSGMIAILVYSLIVCTMIISYQLGVESITSCTMTTLALLPVLVHNMSFVIIAADKALAITSPFKYRRWMKPRVVAAIVTGSWLLAVIPASYGAITSHEDVTLSIPQYGVCTSVEDDYIGYILIYISPITVNSFLAISLNIYLAKIAIQIRKQIEKQTRLSGESAEVTALKKKQRNIQRNMKPIITLLVVTLCSILRILILMVSFFVGRVFEEYKPFLQYVVVANSLYLVHLLNPITYGLYFEQVREPMMKCLKRLTRINKSNAVAPQPRRTAWMWLICPPPNCLCVTIHNRIPYLCCNTTM